MRKISLLVFIVSTIIIGQQRDSSIIFVSDTQAPMWIETLRLQEYDNEKATKLIYRAIDQESTAVAVFHLGDITSIGMFDSYWSSFDDFHNALRLPLYPVVGNHEYFFFKKPAIAQFQKRFPTISSTWYSVVIQSIGIIALNSNFSELSDDERLQQQTWYLEELSKFESDSSICSVIVLSHHSPFTNSTIVDPSQDVQQHFFAPFSMYQKTAVFISGHAHAYEHFRKNGKELLVIGGGGGLLQPLLIGNEQRFYDLFSQMHSLRFFHYIECTVQQNSLQFLVKKLRNDFSGFAIADTVTISVK